MYLAQDCGDAFNKHFRNHAIATRDYKFEALVRLHGAAARIAGEVHKLLLGGYASGAHARWRSLHETAIVALFIAQESNEVAERYFHHQFVKSYEDAQDYQKYAEALGEELLTPEEMAVIDAHYQSVLRRFGNHFKKNEEYGWALAALETRDPSLKGKRIGIKHLQNAVRIEHWTPYYRMASHAIHPSATSIRFGLGTRENTPVILAGPSNVDLTEPGRGALVSLTLATASLLSYQGHLDTFQSFEPSLSLGATIQALNTLVDLAIKAFMEADQKLESEIRSESEPAS